jgi:hypothetical protein
MASLLVLLVIAVLLGALISGIIMWSTSGSGGSGEMSCGACGYPVRGLSQLNCPECGADLRMVGINRQGDPRTKAVGRTLVFASIGILLIGVLGVFFMGDNSSPSPSVPTSVSQPAPSPSISSSPIENADGAKTVINPDGSKIVVHPDGSSTLIQPDGTMTTFNADGEEIPNPEPEGNGTGDDEPAEGESP